MLSRKICIFFAFGLFVTFGTVFAATNCKSCGPNYIACLNETAYRFCLDGKTPSQQGGVCPENQVCTDQQNFCQPKETGKQICGNCVSCISGFVCRSKTQFEYCRGSTPLGIIGKCPNGEYCSIANAVKNHNICIKSCADEPTCYAAEISTTPAPVTEQDYAKSCESASAAGNYENKIDSTCKTYVYCEFLNGVWNAVLKECGMGYFSATDSKCVPTKPTKCT